MLVIVRLVKTLCTVGQIDKRITVPDNGVVVGWCHCYPPIINGTIRIGNIAWGKLHNSTNAVGTHGSFKT